MAKAKTGKKVASKTAKKSPKAKTAGKKGAAKAAKKAPKGKAKRYGEKRKQALLAKYNELRAAGDTAQVAAKKVGVPYITLRSWEKKAGKAAPSAKAALKKAVARKKTRGKKATARKPAAQSGGITLVTPNGFRIEGISSKELISVLKALK